MADGDFFFQSAGGQPPLLDSLNIFLLLPNTQGLFLLSTSAKHLTNVIYNPLNNWMKVAYCNYPLVTEDDMRLSDVN